MWDAVIIGAGISGCSVARELARYDLKVLVLEKGHDLCAGTTRGNSATVHAGYDPILDPIKRFIMYKAVVCIKNFVKNSMFLMFKMV